MNNNSFWHSFTTLDDKRFDCNSDGNLNSFETMFRDAHLKEMNQKVKQATNNKLNIKKK